MSRFAAWGRSVGPLTVAIAFLSVGGAAAQNLETVDDAPAVPVCCVGGECFLAQPDECVHISRQLLADVTQSLEPQVPTVDTLIGESQTKVSIVECSLHDVIDENPPGEYALCEVAIIDGCMTTAATVILAWPTSGDVQDYRDDPVTGQWFYLEVSEVHTVMDAPYVVNAIAANLNMELQACVAQ